MKTEIIKLYENRNDVTLTAYIWEDSSEMLKGGKRPAVIHGMATATQASAGDARDSDANVSKWMELCNLWLLKRFALNIPTRTEW